MPRGCGMSSVGQDDVMGRMATMQWQTEWLFYHELEPTKLLVETNPQKVKLPPLLCIHLFAKPNYVLGLFARSSIPTVCNHACFTRHWKIFGDNPTTPIYGHDEHEGKYVLLKW